MRISSMGKRRGALAIALATGAAVAALGLSGTAAMAQTKPAKAAKAPKGGKGVASYSKAFTALAAPLQVKLDAARVAKAKVDAGNAAAKAEFTAALAGAPAMMAAVEAVAVSGDEKLAAGQFAVNLGGYVSDLQMRQRGVQMMLSSGKLDPAKVAEFQYYLGNFAYANKEYATARTALAAALAGGYPADDAAELMADSYAQSGQPAQGLAELRKAVAARRAAGKPVPAGWVKRATVIAYNNKLGPEAIEWAMIQVELQPSNFHWLGSTQLVRQFAGYGPQETLDLFRLMLRSGALDNEARFVSNEYKEYIEAADPRRLPGETLRVIEKGVAAGALSASNAWVSEARNIATPRLAGDRASLPGQARDARASGSGVGALSVADAYLNYGDAAMAEELYKLAIQKGGIDKDRALTRLGIAQVDQGKWADAKASFAQVAGARTNLAKLWLIYVAQKSGGARTG